jgi:arginine decarboxylase
MNTKYSDLINQTYYFPQEEFTLNKDNLQFHNIDLMKLVEQWNSIKFTYLPQISNINKAKKVFVNRWRKTSMRQNYYCYCTKAHFEYIMNEAFKNNIHIETSSAFDNIVENF